MAGEQPRNGLQRYGPAIRAVGAVLLMLGGIAAVVASLLESHGAGGGSSVNLVTGVSAFVAGVLFGLPVVRAWRARRR